MKSWVYTIKIVRIRMGKSKNPEQVWKQEAKEKLDTNAASPNNMDKKALCPVPVGVISINSLQPGPVIVRYEPFVVVCVQNCHWMHKIWSCHYCHMLYSRQSLSSCVRKSISLHFKVQFPSLWGTAAVCQCTARRQGTATQEQHAGERCRLCFAFLCKGFFGCVLCPFKSLGSLGEPERIAFSVIIW